MDMAASKGVDRFGLGGSGVVGTGMVVRDCSSWRAAAAVVALIVNVYLLRPNAEPDIAKITGLSGSLQWTGEAAQRRQDRRRAGPTPCNCGC